MKPFPLPRGAARQWSIGAKEVQEMNCVVILYNDPPPVDIGNDIKDPIAFRDTHDQIINGPYVKRFWRIHTANFGYDMWPVFRWRDVENILDVLLKERRGPLTIVEYRTDGSVLRTEIK